jgi:hypothetical protein
LGEKYKGDIYEMGYVAVKWDENRMRLGLLGDVNLMMRSDDIIKMRIPWYDIFPDSTQTWLVGEIIYICLDGKYPHVGINMGVGIHASKIGKSPTNNRDQCGSGQLHL